MKKEASRFQIIELKSSEREIIKKNWKSDNKKQTEIKFLSKLLMLVKLFDVSVLIIEKKPKK